MGIKRFREKVGLIVLKIMVQTVDLRSNPDLLAFGLEKSSYRHES